MCSSFSAADPEDCGYSYPVPMFILKWECCAKQCQIRSRFERGFTVCKSPCDPVLWGLLRPAHWPIYFFSSEVVTAVQLSSSPPGFNEQLYYLLRNWAAFSCWGLCNTAINEASKIFKWRLKISRIQWWRAPVCSADVQTTGSKSQTVVSLKVSSDSYQRWQSAHAKPKHVHLICVSILWNS